MSTTSGYDVEVLTSCSDVGRSFIRTRVPGSRLECLLNELHAANWDPESIEFERTPGEMVDEALGQEETYVVTATGRTCACQCLWEDAD